MAIKKNKESYTTECVSSLGSDKNITCKENKADILYTAIIESNQVVDNIARLIKDITNEELDTDRPEIPLGCSLNSIINNGPEYLENKHNDMLDGISHIRMLILG